LKDSANSSRATNSYWKLKSFDATSDKPTITDWNACTDSPVADKIP